MSRVKKYALSERQKQIMKKVLAELIGERLEHEVGRREMVASYQAILEIADEFSARYETALFQDHAYDKVRMRLQTNIVKE